MEDIFESTVERHIEKIKNIFVVDERAEHRLRETLLYLALSLANANPRGINIQTTNLRNILHACRRTNDQERPKFGLKQRADV